MSEILVWKLLLVDDDEDDYLLTREMLAVAQGKEVHLTWATTLEAGREAMLANHYTAVMIDYDLGEHTGLELIHEMTARNDPSPLILLTGRGGYEVDLEAMQAGATLYLMKSELNPHLLDRSIRYAIERRLKEDQITRLTRMYATLSRVNEAIVRTHEAESLYNQICGIVAESGFPLVWIGELKGRAVVPVANCGPAADYLNGIRIEIEGELGQGPTGTCIREDRPVVNPDFATNPATLPWRQEALRYGIRASASFPLHRQGRPAGAFTLYAAEPGAFDDALVALLEQLTNDVSFALDALDQEKLRIQAEEARRESEERYRSLFSGMTEGFALHEIICDEASRPVDWRFLEINPAFESLTGLKREDVVGKRHNEVLPGDDPRWVEIYGAVALGGPPVHFDNYSPALKQHYEVYAYSPAPMQFAVLFMNITERKQLDEKLRQSEQRYRALFQSMQEGFYLLHTLTDAAGQPYDFEYLDVNPAFEKIMGLGRDQIIGQTAKHLVPNIKQGWIDTFHKVEQTGEPTHYSSYSDYFQQYFEAFAFRPEEGQVAVVVADISERKRDEEKLLQQSQLIDLSYEPICSWEIGGCIQSWNRGSESLYGYTREEAVGRVIHDLLKTHHPIPLPDVIAEIKNNGTWTGELVHQTRDGREVIVESRQQLIEVGGRRVVLESNRDITERKRAENALRETHERIKWLASFPDENPNPVARVNFEGQVVYCNPVSASIPGWMLAVGQPLPPILMSYLQQAVAENHEIDGDVQFEDQAFNIWVVPIVAERYVNFYGRDITKRKVVEEALEKSEQKFRTTLASIGDAVVTTDAQGAINFMNPVAEKLSGWDIRSAVGRSMEEVLQLISEATGLPAENPVAKVLESGQVVGMANHTALVTRQGELIPIEDSAAPIKDSAGETEGVVIVFRDVTEKRKKEAALNRSEALYRAIAQNIPDGAVYLFDPELHYLVVEGALIDRLGFSRQQMVGRTIYEVLDPETAKELEERLRYALAGQFLSAEITFGGRTLWSQYQPLLDEDGRVQALLVLSLDITERKKYEEALREAEELMKDYTRQLERSNRELQDFAAIASHDLQEPLRKIKSFSDLLQTRLAGRLDEQEADLLERMQSATRRMHELIESLLILSRVSTKAQPFKPVNMQALAEEVVASLDIQIERLGARVELSNLPVLEADPVQMRQLLQNLIANGLKFHSPGTAPRVWVRGKALPGGRAQDCDSVQIEVGDNGIGFDEKYLERIFRPFERLHGRSEFEGTGMGLAICKKIVERHQGTITAHSSAGAGACFIVTLPLKQND